jgi:hypothetical protein
MRSAAILAIFIFLTACHPTPTPTTAAISPHALPTIKPKPDIRYVHDHSLSDSEAIAAAEALAKRLEKHGMHWHRNSSKMSFGIDRGLLEGVRGTLSLSPHSVEVEIFNFPQIIPRFLAVPRIKREMHYHFKIVNEQ